MLGLSLRADFQSKRLEGTAIELTNEKGQGATQIPAAEFLRITYPSGDLLKALEAVGPDQGRPVVLIGERGQGKSHLLAALYHAMTDAESTRPWLDHWATHLNNPKLIALPLRSGMHVISESMHRQRYRNLWDLLFDRHPHGAHARGKFEGKGTDVPSDEILLEMFQKQPTALVLDEFQTWYDGLTNSKQHPLRTWSFNFIQLLSEIAKEHPELLVLVVSVRNGSTDAYQQLHRVNPVLVDFKGPGADRDRRRLLLHRLFENRLQVPDSEVHSLVEAHVSEYFRLMQVSPAEHERRRHDFLETWPFAPHLLQLLEDQVLVATDAQETRDLIRILAGLYKNYGEDAVLLTAADFRLDGPDSGIMALLDSVANQHHAALREKAQRNLAAVEDAIPDPLHTVPHLSELVGALWLRSLAAGNVAGATPEMLQLDVTRRHPVDGNAFQAELSTIVENSFNIHQVGDRLLFREEENPEAKLKATARSDKLFVDGSDKAQLARETRYVLGGAEEAARNFRVVVLREGWHGDDPWSAVDAADHPDRWDSRISLVVLPESPDQLDARLGTFLRKSLSKRRNTVRFLLPRLGAESLFIDRELLLLSRMTVKAAEWKQQSPEYAKLHTKYQGELRTQLKTRFERYAILETWNFVEPAKCRFHVENVAAQGDKIPDAIDRHIRENVFIPEDFSEYIMEAAKGGRSMGDVLRELQEPRPNGLECIPWLGEADAQERVLRMCARGKLGINVRGMEYLQALPGEDEESAWKRMRKHISTGQHLDQTHLSLPQAAPQTGSAIVDTPVDAPPPIGNLFGTEPQPVPDSGSLPASPPSGSGSTSVFSSPAAGTGKKLSAPPTSSLNLLGRVESWGIGPATPVRSASLQVGSLTGAQLQKLLRALPDGVIYALDVETEES